MKSNEKFSFFFKVTSSCLVSGCHPTAVTLWDVSLNISSVLDLTNLLVSIFVWVVPSWFNLVQLQLQLKKKQFLCLLMSCNKEDIFLLILPLNKILLPIELYVQMEQLYLPSHGVISKKQHAYYSFSSQTQMSLLTLWLTLELGCSERKKSQFCEQSYRSLKSSHMKILSALEYKGLVIVLPFRVSVFVQFHATQLFTHFAFSKRKLHTEKKTN